MAETEKLDALGLIQEQMYADIADFIVRDSVIRAIGEDNPDVSRNFWLTLVDNPEGIAKLFYEHLERLGRAAEFEHAGNLSALFGGTDVIDFKRIYAYREDDFGCTDSSEASLERAKKLLIPLIEEEIPTQKLICMLCYCETHRKYSSGHYNAFQDLVCAASHDSTITQCNMELAIQSRKRSKEVIEDVKTNCDSDKSEWYNELFKDIESTDIPIISVNYSEEDFTSDYKKYIKNWYYDSPTRYKIKLEEQQPDDCRKIVKNGLTQWEFKEIPSSNKYYHLEEYYNNFMDFFGFDNFFISHNKYPTLPRIIYKEAILTLYEMKSTNCFGKKGFADSFVYFRAIFALGNFYLLHLAILAFMSKFYPDWGIDLKTQIQNSLRTEGVRECLQTYAFILFHKPQKTDYMMEAHSNIGIIKNFSEGMKQEPFRVSNLAQKISEEDYSKFIEWIDRYSTDSNS